MAHAFFCGDPLCKRPVEPPGTRWPFFCPTCAAALYPLDVKMRVYQRDLEPRATLRMTESRGVRVPFETTSAIPCDRRTTIDTVFEKIDVAPGAQLSTRQQATARPHERGPARNSSARPSITPENRRSLLPLVPTLAMWGLFVVGLSLSPNAIGWIVVVNVLLFAAIVGFSTAVHELAHATTAWLMGFWVTDLSVGRGPVIVRRVMGRTTLILHAVPATGMTMVVPSNARALRVRLAAVFIAAPILHGILFALLYPFTRFEPGVLGIRLAPLEIGALVQATLGIANGLPLRKRRGESNRGNDGLMFFVSLFRKPSPPRSEQ